MPATTPKQSKMPFPEANNSKENGDDRPRISYVRCNLTSEQKKEMAEWANSKKSDDMLDYIDELCEEDYVLSVKPGKDGGCQASLTSAKQVSIHNRNSGKSLVTRASTPIRAIWSILYKHYEVLGRDWSQGSTDVDLDW
jgi:hypothetical protein